MTAPAQVRTALVFAALMLVTAFALKRVPLPDPDLPERAVMVLLGLSYVWTGNALARRRPSRRMDEARGQEAVRFEAWSTVLSGLAFATVWLVLPTGVAAPLSAAFLVGGAITAVVYRVRRGGAC